MRARLMSALSRPNRLLLRKHNASPCPLARPESRLGHDVPNPPFATLQKSDFSAFGTSESLLL
jgi:hypothetical protein